MKGRPMKHFRTLTSQVRRLPRTVLGAGLAGVLAVSAASGAVLAATSTAAHAASGASIVAVAQGELANSSRNHEVGDNCNFYSGYWSSGSNDCGTAGFRRNAWCADFARYVWKTAGVSTLTGLDPWAYSFARYGSAQGTLHVAGSGY